MTRHPATAPHVRAAAMTYALANDPEYRDLATVASHLTGRTVSRFTHVHQGVQDLIKKVKLTKALAGIAPERGRKGGKTCPSPQLPAA